MSALAAMVAASRSNHEALAQRMMDERLRLRLMLRKAAGTLRDVARVAAAASDVLSEIEGVLDGAEAQR